MPQLAAFSAAILASIFLRAARIISSLRFCSRACLSSRFELQPLLPFSFSASIAASAACCCAIFSCSLYLVIRSGWDGFSAALDAAAVAALAAAGLVPGGGGG